MRTARRVFVVAACMLVAPALLAFEISQPAQPSVGALIAMCLADATHASLMQGGVSDDGTQMIVSFKKKEKLITVALYGKAKDAETARRGLDEVYIRHIRAAAKSCGEAQELKEDDVMRSVEVLYAYSGNALGLGARDPMKWVMRWFNNGYQML